MALIESRSLAISAGAMLLALAAVAQDTAPIPFATTPAILGKSEQTGYTFLVREADQTYSQLHFSLDPPYNMLGAIESFVRILTGTSRFQPSAAQAPPLIGMASQGVALGDFVGDHSPSVAVVSVNQRNTILVYNRSEERRVGKECKA
jgi:hypothetical protein